MITHHFVGGVYAKETHIPAGYVLGKHTHDFDHLSILANGTVELTVDGQVRLVNAPACITIEAGKEHCIKSVSDVVWYCIHATDCTDPAQVDQVLIER